MPEEHLWAEQVAAYVLDALDEDERRAFAAHLAQCPRCQADAATLAPVPPLPNGLPQVAVRLPAPVTLSAGERLRVQLTAG